MLIRLSFVATLAVLFQLSGGAAATLKQEPPEGKLRPGQIVFVDDGTCPADQIKRIMGGSNMTGSGGFKAGGTSRITSCVPQSSAR